MELPKFYGPVKHDQVRFFYAKSNFLAFVRNKIDIHFDSIRLFFHFFRRMISLKLEERFYPIRGNERCSYSIVIMKLEVRFFKEGICARREKIKTHNYN